MTHKEGDALVLTDTEDFYPWLLEITKVQEYYTTGRLYELGGGHIEDGELVTPLDITFICEISPKWDGCTNVSWDTYCATHHCGGHHLVQFCLIFQAAFRELHGCMPEGNRNEADVDDLHEDSAKWKAVPVKLSAELKKKMEEYGK